MLGGLRKGGTVVGAQILASFGRAEEEDGWVGLRCESPVLLRSGSFLREELPSAACVGGGAGEGGSSHLPGAAQAEGEGGGATAAEVEGVGWTEGRRAADRLPG
jgi:hypothetical protein